MSPLQYLTEEWRAEAERQHKTELTPERMNHITGCEPLSKTPLAVDVVSR